MRIHLTLALLTAALLSGCTGGADDPQPSQPDDGQPDRHEHAAETTYESTVWGSQSFVVTPATDGYFQVQVPQGARNASVRLEGGPEAGTAIEVRLEGCGEATTGSLTVAVGSTVHDFGLCAEPAPGESTLTVRAPTAAVAASVTVYGLAPA